MANTEKTFATAYLFAIEDCGSCRAAKNMLSKLSFPETAVNMVSIIDVSNFRVKHFGLKPANFLFVLHDARKPSWIVVTSIIDARQYIKGEKPWPGRG